MGKFIKGVNDFKTWCNENNLPFLNDWDYEKNDVLPDQVSRGSHKLLFWKCSKCGDSYTRQPHHFKVNGENGCPKCWIRIRGARRSDAAVKKNNFKENYPQLASEWSEDNEISSDEVSFNSNKNYLWECSRCGHKWSTSIGNRLNGTGCPKCKSIFHTSFPEQAIYYYLSLYFSDSKNGDKHLGFELDIYIPSKKIAIEYDGKQWHQDPAKDERKNNSCKENGIKLIRVKEDKNLSSNCDKVYYCESENDKELEMVIKEILIYLGIDHFDVNIERDKNKIYDRFLISKEGNSLETKYPDIAKEWHPTKNYPLVPSKVDYGSGISFVWICSKCGYEFVATPNSRTCKKSGCPSCNHIVVWEGHTDLATINPSLASEWDYDKNDLKPTQVLPNSEKRVWWKCSKCGHSWEALVGNRFKGRGCPMCSMAKRFKKVRCIETNNVYNSIKEASETKGCAKGKITECCKGKRKTAGGYHWEYVED